MGPPRGRAGTGSRQGPGGRGRCCTGSSWRPPPPTLSTGAQPAERALHGSALLGTKPLSPCNALLPSLLRKHPRPQTSRCRSCSPPVCGAGQEQARAGGRVVRGALHPGNGCLHAGQRALPAAARHRHGQPLDPGPSHVSAAKTQPQPPEGAVQEPAARWQRRRPPGAAACSRGHDRGARRGVTAG